MKLLTSVARRGISALPSASSDVPCTLLGRHSYVFTIQYDGTDYSGWQLQAGSGHQTIQGHVESSLSTVLRHDRLKLRVCGAGRTDKGVHALGNVVQFYSDSLLDPVEQKLESKLNGLLPHDIRVKGGSLVRTSPDFMITVSATAKTYVYSIDTNTFSNPLTRRFSMYTGPRSLDIDLMKEAALLFIGTHDFLQLSNRSIEERNPVKTIQQMEVSDPDDEGIMRITVRGDGFLYKQVRHMVGLLIAVGQGSVDSGLITELLQMGSQQLPGLHGITRGYRIADAKGLMLKNVEFLPRAFNPLTLLYPDRDHDEHGRLVEVSGPSLRRQGFVDPDF
jgi:tRNA pseudouridine38-40 synthase